jgi:hypothetical protein
MSESQTGKYIFMAAVGLLTATAVYFSNQQPRPSRQSGSEPDSESEGYSSSSSDDDWRSGGGFSDNDSESESDDENEVEPSRQKEESPEERRDRLVQESMDRDRRMQEIQSAREEIDRREREWEKQQPTTSLKEWNRIEKHKDDVRVAKRVNDEDQQVVKGTLEKVEKIHDTFDTLSKAGGPKGRDRPELFDKTVDDTIDDLRDISREARDMKRRELEELEETGRQIGNMNEDELEDVINRRKT